MTEIEAAFDDLEVRDSTKIAVLDIGSNSFHLVVVRVISGTVQILHKLKQKVRLAEGLSEEGFLSEEAIRRGLDTIKLFEKSISGFDPDSVRIVGTYTLRKAKNSHKFIKAARKVISYPVEIISGQEEARLIYQGVAHTHNLQGQTLVIDIGGGSTEFAIGANFEPKILRSLDMGCVSYTQRFFKNGKLTNKAFEQAITAAQQQLEKIEDKYLKLGWDTCIGASGSIESVMTMACDKLDYCEHQLTLEQMERLQSYCVEKGELTALKLGEANEERRNVFPAGLAILIAVFRSLKIKHLEFSPSALREGVIYEMDESLHHNDVRERSVQSLATRYDVDTEQAGLVLDTCFNLYQQVKEDWDLVPDRVQSLLGWSALLHEIGLHIHSRGVQKHSSYILQHADMHGFNAEQQTFLSMMVRFHRKKIKLAELPELTQFRQIELLQCLILLRLSVLLNIKRQSNFVPDVRIEVDDHSIQLTFPNGWLAEHRVISADLEQEQYYLNNIGFKLTVVYINAS